MPEITVDGVVYVPKEECKNDAQDARWAIAVLDCGFVYVGYVIPTFDNDIPTGILIKEARAIVRWGTTAHLGELINGPLPNTKLGASCTVRVPLASLIQTIDVEESKWKAK